MSEYRDTIQRKLVLDTIKKLSGQHPSAENVYELITETFPGISRGTVYRNLNLLAERGDILKLELPLPPDRFDDTTSPHYHMQCRVCGCVADARVAFQRDLPSRIGDTGGFKVEGHDIIFKGICKNCQSK